MTHEDIEAAYRTIEGAVGSTEQPADPWRGITGPPGFGPPSIPGMAPISWKDFATIAGEGAEPGPGWAYGTDTGGVTVTSRFTPPACPSAQPEIPVTDEMIRAAQGAYVGDVNDKLFCNAFRAMAALAPPNEIAIFDPVRALNERHPDYGNVLAKYDAQTVCLADKDREILMLRAERDVWQKLYNDRVSQAQLVSFTGATSDMPDPPRRPDGTLVPTAKPWGAPKPSGDPRRIGG